MTMKLLYTAHATATGGRNGHTQTEDGLISVDLSIPKAMGGPGKPGTTTPEDLFAAGYAACFGSACEFMSRQLKLIPKTIEVKAAVGIGQTPEGGFALAVTMNVHMTGLSQEDAEKVVNAAHTVCPYSNATRNNIEVTLVTTTS